MNSGTLETLEEKDFYFLWLQGLGVIIILTSTQNI